MSNQEKLKKIVYYSLGYGILFVAVIGSAIDSGNRKISIILCGTVMAIEILRCLKNGELSFITVATVVAIVAMVFVL